MNVFATFKIKRSCGGVWFRYLENLEYNGEK